MNIIKSIAKFDIVNKEGQSVPFEINNIQERLINNLTKRDIVLKPRQVGISSVILAMFALDFLLVENSRSVCISHDSPSAQRLLDRVRYFLKSAEDKGLAINLKINNRNELINSDKNSTFYISQAGSTLRGDTINNLHIAEWARFPNPEEFLLSALQAVTPTGKAIIESTSFGTNFFKTYWEKSKNGETGFKTHFFDNSFYSAEFLNDRRKELGQEKFNQEFPANDLDCFLSSGNPYFDTAALKSYLLSVKEPVETYNGFYDLLL